MGDLERNDMKTEGDLDDRKMDNNEPADLKQEHDESAHIEQENHVSPQEQHWPADSKQEENQVEFFEILEAQFDPERVYFTKKK